MSDPKPRGRFVWFDLMTTDPDRAVAFYTKVTGWGTAPWTGPIPYTMWTNGGLPLGGVMKLPADAGAPPHWLAYISSPDVDATVREATSLGGRAVMAPSDIPTVGRFAVLTDPQRAMFAVFTPVTHAPGHEGPAECGEFSWHELATTDPGAALAFYQTLFGWEKTSAMEMGPAGQYQMYGRSGIVLGGIYTKEPQRPGPPAWLHYVRVGDADGAAERARSGGGQIVTGPMDVPGGGRIAVCVDPQGAMFALHAIKKQ